MACLPINLLCLLSSFLIRMTHLHQLSRSDSNFMSRMVTSRPRLLMPLSMSFASYALFTDLTMSLIGRSFWEAKL